MAKWAAKAPESEADIIQRIVQMIDKDGNIIEEDDQRLDPEQARRRRRQAEIIG